MIYGALVNWDFFEKGICSVVQTLWLSKYGLSFIFYVVYIYQIRQLGFVCTEKVREVKMLLSEWVNRDFSAKGICSVVQTLWLTLLHA
jgi:hypothetical protein